MCRCLYQDAACSKERSPSVVDGDMFPLAYGWPKASTLPARGIFKRQCDIDSPIGINEERRDLWARS